MRGLFVTATDTGVGKTVLSAALLAAARADGEPVRAYKPVVTGLEDPERSPRAEPGRPTTSCSASAADMAPRGGLPAALRPAVSPHLAAELAGDAIDAAALVARPARRRRARRRTLIVEGVGGLLVPLREELHASATSPPRSACRC